MSQEISIKCREMAKIPWEKLFSKESKELQPVDLSHCRTDLKQRQGNYSVEDLLTIGELIIKADPEDICLTVGSFSKDQWEYLGAMGRGLRRARFLDNSVNPIADAIRLWSDLNIDVFHRDYSFLGKDHTSGSESIVLYSLGWALSYLYGCLQILQEIIEKDLLTRYRGVNILSIPLHAAAFTGPLQGWEYRDTADLTREVREANELVKCYLHRCSLVNTYVDPQYGAARKYRNLKAAYPLIYTLNSGMDSIVKEPRLGATNGYLLSLLAWYEPYLNINSANTPARQIKVTYDFMDCVSVLMPDPDFVLYEACNKPGNLPDKVVCLVLNRHSNALLPCYVARTGFGLNCLLIPSSRKVLDIMVGIYGIPRHDSLFQESISTQCMLGVGAEDYAITVMEHTVRGRNILTYDRPVDIRDFINGVEELSDTNNSAPENIFHMVYIRKTDGILIMEKQDG